MYKLKLYNAPFNKTHTRRVRGLGLSVFKTKIYRTIFLWNASDLTRLTDCTNFISTDTRENVCTGCFTKCYNFFYGTLLLFFTNSITKQLIRKHFIERIAIGDPWESNEEVESHNT